MRVEEVLHSEHRHRIAMERGSQKMKYVLAGNMKAPRDLVWSSDRSGTSWAPGNRPPEYPRAREKERAALAALARRTSRDPCGFCGVRRDIGCKHHAV